ncbi:MAG: serine/threonine-protein kinase [Candidatus Sulfopaludibacter sp.]|nr:serine/threonine-protein kinase [Candidatus Sulfopaludibacter sp.]
MGVALLDRPEALAYNVSILMVRCPSCSRESDQNGRFCSWCAAALDATSAETVAIVAAAPASVPRLTSSSAVDEGRFLPGTMIAGRYRVAGLLGRGGMGEVYRATDLTLGQAVALKFLPEAAARDDRALARFYNEVRMARQVTHPNVCRVYDIGQIDGLHFISMEYVDGEDLSSLLRRIGRLPADKAVEIARKLCAGLGAAHEKNVLHRDLKPANVMVDSRGQVIIMDFGLAGLTEQLQGDARSGTPAYMSPEQLAGTGVTPRSDLYALGLVLYELFTGRRAFEAASLVELMEMQERAAPASITSVAKDLDPAVERIVLRCLQSDPRLRPASAMAIAAALPGGDPLEAALAAGETPSPELVAAAGETEGMNPVRAVALLAAALLGTGLIAIFGVRFFITEKVPMDVPPDALAVNARNLLRGLGYTAKPGGTAWGLDYNGEYLRYLNRRKDGAARWQGAALREAPLIVFWYRQSPDSLQAVYRTNTAVTEWDPPLVRSGMLRIFTDAQGRLEKLEAVPRQVEADSGAAPAFDWARLFQAAGLDQGTFREAKPEWSPLAPFDSRAAWTGTDSQSGARLRVEAAAWRGRPVFFQIVGPWSAAVRDSSSTGGEALALVFVKFLAFAVACVFAWHNVRTAKGDIRGATKLGLIYFMCSSAASLLQANHSATSAEFTVVWVITANCFLNAIALGAFYLALEPWVRKRWPQTMISWSRLTTHGIRDPLVGQSILVGVIFACLLAAMKLLQLALHGPGGEPVFAYLYPLLGIRQAMAGALTSFTGSLFDPIFGLLLLFLIRIVLRNQWLSMGVFIALLAALNSSGTGYPRTDIPLYALMAAINAFLLMRYGLLVGMVSDLLYDFIIGIPRTLDFSLWYASTGMLPLVLTGLIAIYGFRVALGGRKLLTMAAP